MSSSSSSVDSIYATRLHKVVAQQQRDKVYEICARGGVDGLPWDKNSNGDTPLHLAAYYGDLKIVKILIQFVGSCRSVNHRSQRPIDVARIRGWQPIVDYLSEKESKGRATKSNNQVKVEARRKLAKHTRRDLKRFFAAAKSGDVDALMKIIAQGVDVSIQDLDGNTALHWATLYGQDRVVDRLLRSYKADPLSLNFDHESSFHLAALNGNLKLLKLLNQYAPDLSWLRQRDCDGQNVLHRAVWLAPKPKVVNFLIGLGANVNGVNRFGYTPSTGSVTSCL